MENSRNGFTLWFTGLPCSGKSTLANLVAREIERRGRGVVILDGDVVRRHLTKGLGFSKEDRDENIRRIGWVCGLLSRFDAVAIAAAISPYRSVRQEVRSSIERFVEIYVKTSLETCIQRDVKGMYKKALAGEIKNFTGIDDPYEPPDRPELVIETEAETPEESASRIVSLLERLNLVSLLPQPDSSPEQAQQTRLRLSGLGYIER
jgi:adenylylsulfate kinase